MKVKDLIEYLKSQNAESEIVISKAFVIDEKEGLTGILDIPVLGIASKEGELRFVLDTIDVKSCFKPEEIYFLSDEDKKNLKGE
jgi:Mg/Co/Ni transporter MgtE